MATAKVKMSAQWLKAIKVTGERQEFSDSGTRGLHLTVWPSGVISWTFRYRFEQKVYTLTLGQYPAVSLADARAKLALAQVALADGRNPKVADSTGKPKTVADLLKRFVAEKVDTDLKPKTAHEYRRLIDAKLIPALGGKAVNGLMMEHVTGFYDRERRAAPTQAAAAVRVLRSAMSWAAERGLRDANTVNPAKISIGTGRRRERLFSDKEVSQIHAALDGLENDATISAQAATGVRLLFATGCRANEICTLRWQDVNLETKRMRFDSKTGYMEKPITGEALAILHDVPRVSPWILPAITDPTKAIRHEIVRDAMELAMAKAGVVADENASLHLIRHWFATKIYTDATIPLPVQMLIVGHKSVATAMRYAHPDKDVIHAAAEAASTARLAKVAAAAKGAN